MRRPFSRRRILLVFLFLAVANATVIVFLYRNMIAVDSRSNYFIASWFNADDKSPLATDNIAPCAGAPFLLPSSGFIGLLYADPARPYNGLSRHTGIDIFGDGDEGEVAVVAVYDGYLTRLDDWFSTVIIRHDDPLQPGRVIWTYYTHMASRDGSQSFVSAAFPPGTVDLPVSQGTFLGYQGAFSGGGPRIGMHVHMSIVTSDADGSFKNEAVLNNTLDPSPYFGLPLNIEDDPPRPIRCVEAT